MKKIGKFEEFNDFTETFDNPIMVISIEDFENDKCDFEAGEVNDLVGFRIRNGVKYYIVREVDGGLDRYVVAEVFDTYFMEMWLFRNNRIDNYLKNI